MTSNDLTFAEVSAVLAESESSDDAVERLVTFAVSNTDMTCGGITLIRRGHTFETVGATDSRVLDADHAQYELNQGPCIEAADVVRSLWSRDVASDERWPLWGPRAADIGLRSVISSQLFSRGSRIGALNLYRDRPGAPDPDMLDFIVTFARQGAAILARLRNEEGLLQALDTRTRIGQAQGILMERFTIDADRAFDVLRRYSQDTNTRLAEVAAAVVEGRTLAR